VELFLKEIYGSIRKGAKFSKITRKYHHFEENPLEIHLQNIRIEKLEKISKDQKDVIEALGTKIW